MIVQRTFRAKFKVKAPDVKLKGINSKREIDRMRDGEGKRTRKNLR